MNEAYLLLGSNEGDRVQLLHKAIDMLTSSCGPVMGRSSVYETAAWGITDQPAFLNMVVLIQTDKSPTDLLATVLAVEAALGRQRELKWGQRTIDIDILLYNDLIINEPGLTIPHPFMHKRRFTLVPLAEIAPSFLHPKLGKTIATLLAECPDSLAVHKYELI